MRLPRKSFSLPDSKVQPPKKRGYKTEHIKLALTIDFDRKRLVGVATLMVTPSQKETQKIEFDADAMDIERVALDGKDVPFDYDNETLSVLVAGVGLDVHHVEVHYSTTSTSRGVHFVGPDEQYPDKPVQVWTHSETQDARYWYPCNDEPDDRATSEMVMTVPEGFQCISNGKLLSRVVKGKEAIYHWSEATAHSTYLNSFAIGAFEEIREEADGVPLLYYFDKSNRKDAIRFFGETPDMLKVYNKMIGVPYPFEQYAQVCVRDFTFGGMEHVAATTMTDLRFPDERSEEDYSSSYSRPDRTPLDLVGHELVHQWYGDLVTMTDWPHAWLNEGFATYFQALYVETVKGVDEFRQNMAYKAAAHLDEDEKRYRRPIVEKSFVYPDDLFDSVLYEKASWMLHQLRFIVGDGTFLSGMTAYLKEFAGRNADTDDLRKVLEEVSGRSLGQEFDQFFYKPGYPEFEVEYSWDVANSTAELLIRQVQDTADGTPIFDLPCDVVFYSSRGRNKTRLRLAKEEEKFSFRLDERPTIVEFDPEEWLLKTVRFKKSYDVLVNQLESSLDATSRVRAAQDLAQFRTDKTVDVLGKVLLSDQFWSVRAEAARSMGKIGTPAALKILLFAVGTRHRKVRRAVVEGLGNFKDEDSVAAIRNVLMEDISPNIQAEAALSLSKTSKKDVLDDLIQAMKIPSPNWTLTEACLEAMGRIKDSDAKKVLDEHLRYGIPTRARIGALKGLKVRGFLDETEVAVLREILTSDGEFMVRLQVISLISDLVDGRFLGALERASEEDLDKRVRRRSLEVINELTRTQAAASITSKLRVELEELLAENERLRRQLDPGR